MKLVLPLLGSALLSSCLFFLPSARNAARWMVTPEPGTTYTFLITSEWQDHTENAVTADYVVERVEDLEDGTTVVKLIDNVHSSDFYWILDRESDAIYESNDPMIDDTDLQIIAPPVRADTSWSFGTGDYEIRTIRRLTRTETGWARDAVEVAADFSDISGMDLIYEWSPDYGLFFYREAYDSDSYMDQYTRELTAVTRP
jgi:hypothetical protein